MLKRSLYSFLALSFVMLAVSVAQAKDLPTTLLLVLDPIQVPAGTTVDQVKKAVRKGMYLKSWQIREVGPGQLQGQFKKGEKYAIVVDVKYDAKTVSIAYKDSSGLNYGGGSIHKTYNDRISDLEKMIRAELDAF